MTIFNGSFPPFYTWETNQILYFHDRFIADKAPAEKRAIIQRQTLGQHSTRGA